MLCRGLAGSRSPHGMERTKIYSPQPTPLGGPSRPMLHATVLSPSAANAPLPTLTPLRRDSGAGGLTRNNFRWKSEGGRKGKCHRATRTGRGAGRTPTAPAVTEPGEPSREGDEEGTRRGWSCFLPLLISETPEPVAASVSHSGIISLRTS